MNPILSDTPSALTSSPLSATSNPVEATPAIANESTLNQTRKPNIIFVFIDDMGYGDLGCYGSAQAKTPNMDRLAVEGLRFTQFYVNSPICSPSRTACMTGQYPARWNITSYIDNRALNQQRNMAQWLDVRAPLLPRFLVQSGYATGQFGKWHLGGGRDVGEAPLPTHYGFDESLTQFEGLGDRVLPLLSGQDGRGEEKMPLGVASEKLGRGEVTWQARSKVTSSFIARALEFIQSAQQNAMPFYINLWPDDVHTPLDPSPEHRGDGSKHDRYLGVLQEMDEQLGPLFDQVRQNPELRDNTLIILASDNGPEEGAGSAGPFRGSKAMLYEGGIREPLIVWGPGLIPPEKNGTVNSTTVLAATDFAPSLLHIAGIEGPSSVHFDGLEMSAALLGHAAPIRTTPLFWKRPPDRPGPNNSWPDLAVRDGDWKLLMEENGAQPELYDLKTDAGETKNVAEQKPEIVQRLRHMLLQWNATLPVATKLQRATTPHQTADCMD